MLLQSRQVKSSSCGTDKDWTDYSFFVLRARENITVPMSCTIANLTSTTLYSPAAGKAIVRHNGSANTIVFAAGQAVKISE